MNSIILILGSIALAILFPNFCLFILAMLPIVCIVWLFRAISRNERDLANINKTFNTKGSK